MLDARFPHETEAELVDRRGRESDEAHRAFWAEVEARRAAGIPDVPCLLPAAGCGGKFDPHDMAQGREKRGRRGYA